MVNKIGLKLTEEEEKEFNKLKENLKESNSDIIRLALKRLSEELIKEEKN